MQPSPGSDCLTFQNGVLPCFASTPRPKKAATPAAKTPARSSKKTTEAKEEPVATVSTVEAEVKRPATTGAQEVVLMGGMPAGGKTTITRSFTDRGYERLNRDTVGGSVADLLPHLESFLSAGRSVVMDNLYATRASRAAAVALAQKRKVPIRFNLMDTSLEDAQFNACLRMMDRCGKVLHPEDHKKAPFKDDPNLFPVAVLYRFRKEYEEPTTAEGFSAVEKTAFVRRFPAEWTNRAVIFDFDGTLRTHEGKEKYPVQPGEVRAFKERSGRIKEYQKKGYLLFGASNQSGVAKGTLTAADAEACFAETLKQLGLTFGPVLYCPHRIPPISCYCRKPGPGMGVELIVKHKLDPRQCIYVGDLGTDKSFAQRCGFQFIDHETFFA